jgi:transcription factor IIIB subunit 2
MPTCDAGAAKAASGRDGQSPPERAAEEDFLAIVPVTEPAGRRRQQGQQQPQEDTGLPSGAEEAEAEELSDMESDEEQLYLHTAEEAKLKELIWTELNRDYLERQSAKAAAQEAAAAKVRAADGSLLIHPSLPTLGIRCHTW